jgi:LPS O-antigen subunit length determinant protein (WzzB/FepE family)
MPDNMPVEQWAGSGVTNALHDTIKIYQEEHSQQTEQMVQLTRQMLRLTWTIAILTFVMLVGLGMQMYFVVKQVGPTTDMVVDYLVE